MISGGFLLLLVMMSSADQEVKEDLTSTVGGEVTVPGPVKSRVNLVKLGVVIASVRESVLEIEHEGFLGRLSWDRDTGRFTIRRLQTDDSGIYSVNVKGTAVPYKLSVYDAVLEPSVSVTSSSSEGCTLLCVVDKLSGGTLSWYKGEDLVNQSSTQLSLSLTVDRLGLQSSYRCVSANPAGNLTRSVNATTSCTGEQLPGDEDEEESISWVWIVISVICVTVIVTVIFCVVKRKKTDRHRQASTPLDQGVSQQEEAVQPHSTIYDLLQSHSIAASPASAAEPEANEDLKDHTGGSCTGHSTIYDLLQPPSIAGSPASPAALA